MFLNAHKKKIKDIVAENYVYGAVLQFFGIAFYSYSEDTLAEVCKAKKLDVGTVVRGLENAVQLKKQDALLRLSELPLDVLIGYLKKAHQSFIRHKLPYLADIITNIQPEYFDQPHIARDLRFVFPLFAEDFIRHIYEEEKRCFGYIERLEGALRKGTADLTKIFYDIQHHGIEKMMAEHLEDDDEMTGIRELTNNYLIDEQTGLYTKIVYSELKAFEKDLKTHSTIENDMLFPKAARLEQEVLKVLAKRASLN